MKETEQIRKAEKKDIDAVAAIYAHIHEQERTGKATIGWLPGIYPVRGTAEAALAQENGCTVLRSECGSQNLPAVLMFKHLGFERVGVASIKVSGVVQADGHIFFEKKL